MYSIDRIQDSLSWLCILLTGFRIPEARLCILSTGFRIPEAELFILLTEFRIA